MNVDTLAIARDLRATELPAAQAEAIAAAIGRSVNDGVATKPDIEIIVQKIDALDAWLTATIESARSSLLIWLMGIIVASVGVVIAVLKF
jgi:hypothetical protein